MTEQTYGVSEHHCGSVAPVHGVSLPNWEWNVPAGQCIVSQSWNCVEWFQEHDVEFQLMSWPPNSPDQNSNTTKLQYLGFTWPLLMSGTICLRPFTKDLWHPCHGWLQLCFRGCGLQAKGGPTRFLQVVIMFWLMSVVLIFNREGVFSSLLV